MRDSDRSQYEAELLAARANADAVNAALRKLNATLEQRLANEIGERLALEGSLSNERKISALREETIAVLGHDLRNHLAAFAAGVRMISKTPLDERAVNLVPMIRQNVIEMTGLIDKVMDFARSHLIGFPHDREAAELELRARRIS